MSGWLSKSSANRFKQTYIRGFLEISGGDFTLQRGNAYIYGDTSFNGNIFVNNNIITQQNVYVRQRLTASDIYNNGNINILTGDSSGNQINIGYYSNKTATNKITIGDEGDTIMVGGYLFNSGQVSRQVNPNIVNPKIITLLTPSGEIGTVNGSGIHFKKDIDGNSYSSSIGYIVISDDYKGFDFKTTNGSNYVDNYPNVVKFDIQNLQLNDRPSTDRGLVTLTRESNNRHVIGIAPNIGLENVLVKQKDTTGNTAQIIDTKIGINNNAYVKRFFVVGRDDRISSDMMLTVDGNAYVTKLNISSTEIDENFNLKLQGDMSQIDGFIKQF